MTIAIQGTSLVTTAPIPTSATETVRLAPSFTLPIAFVLIGIALFLLQPWVGGAIALFGLFLLLQSVTLHLVFTDTALDVYRGDTLIRHFPYQEWSHWEIFWTPVPILFYFREVKSIHFLPIIFDAKMLVACLKQRCPQRPVSPS